MMDVISIVFSVAMYVLQALGLYTIAARRGIRHAWLAWVPVGSVWVLGTIADDFKLKTQGKRWVMRVVLPILVAAVLVLSVAMIGVVLDTLLTPLQGVVSFEELYAVYAGMESDSVSHMYEPVQEDAVEQLVEKLDAALTDAVLEEMTGGLVVIVLLSVGLCILSIAGMVVEYLCWYQVFASCEPANKTLYLVISAVFGLQAIFVFVCRDKDLGMAPANPGLPGARDYGEPRWEN